MKKIMTIWFHFRNKAGCLAIGGTNPDLDNLSIDDIYKMITPDIIIKKSDGAEKKVKVLDTKITSSIRDKKNIYILLPEDTNESDIEKGAIVYTVTERL